MDVGRERRDEHAALATRDDLAEGLSHKPLGARDAGPLGIRRVAEEQVDAAIAELGEPSDIGAQAVDGRVIELPVAGMENPTRRGLDGERNRVGDGVGNAHELDAERADLDRAPLRLRLPELGRLKQTMLVELGLGQPESQSRCPDLWHAHLSEQIRERTDVVLVGMREDHGPDAVAAVDEVRHVWEDQVDAQVLVPGERKPGVDDDDLAVEIVDRHVLADLADAAQRDDAKGFRHQCSIQ